jgi:acetylornithine deacetylase/succinyl-diaminopimelate desuccinylase-like protein
MSREIQRIWQYIDQEQLTALALDLVNIPSPTQSNHKVAERIEEELVDIGLDVEMHKPFPESCVVVGRQRGVGGGPTLEFNGHNDHVPLKHNPPEVRGDRLYGRGSVDMKGNLASLLIALRALARSGIKLKGDILFTSHGLHEFPGRYQHSQDRRELLTQGIHGDACIVLEGPTDRLPVRHGGLIVYEVDIERDGDISHELWTSPGTPNPLLLGARLSLRLQDRTRELSDEEVPLLGPDTYHVGILGGGDYFNRFANRCRIVGSRRFRPGRTFEECLAELEQYVAEVVAGTEATGRVQMKAASTPGEISPDNPLVKAFQSAHEEVSGRELPLAGLRLGTDVLLYLNQGIPALCHGPRGGGAHADIEWVDLADLQRCARLWASAAVNYCRLA